VRAGALAVLGVLAAGVELVVAGTELVAAGAELVVAGAGLLLVFELPPHAPSSTPQTAVRTSQVTAVRIISPPFGAARQPYAVVFAGERRVRAD
jgi:hypothetical protein